MLQPLYLLSALLQRRLLLRSEYAEAIVLGARRGHFDRVQRMPGLDRGVLINVRKPYHSQRLRKSGTDNIEGNRMGYGLPRMLTAERSWQRTAFLWVLLEDPVERLRDQDHRLEGGKGGGESHDTVDDIIGEW